MRDLVTDQSGAGRNSTGNLPIVSAMIAAAGSVVAFLGFRSQQQQMRRQYLRTPAQTKDSKGDLYPSRGISACITIYNERHSIIEHTYGGKVIFFLHNVSGPELLHGLRPMCSVAAFTIMIVTLL